MTMTEDHRQIVALGCPVHPGNAGVRRVSVVFEDMAPRLLSPGPVSRAATRLAWAGTVCGVLGMAAIWAGAVLGGGAFLPGLIAGIVCVAYALALYGWASARWARLTMVERGVPGVLAIWQAAWYCDVCDGVFFQPGTLREPPAATVLNGTVSDGDVISPAAFQRLIGKAGRSGGSPRGLTG
jgi:hypothetical protein